MNLDDLKAKGFAQNEDGSWSKPSAGLHMVGLQTDRSESVTTKALVRSDKKRPSSKTRLGNRETSTCYIIRMVAFRKRLVDPDAREAQFKHLTDCIARDIGIDDADPRIKWEWSQVETRGVEGVVVTVEEIL